MKGISLNTLNMLFQVLLPLALAIIMLNVGLKVRGQDFRWVATNPQWLLWGLSLQWLLPPLVAFAVIGLLSPPVEVAVGLLLIALCPGGVSSNFLTSLARGQVSLSICLTAIVSLLAPLSIPFFFAAGLGWLALEQVSITLPFMKTVMQLLLVTALPILLAFALKHFAPQWTARWQKRLDVASLGLFVFVVVAFTALNWPKLPALWSTATGGSLLLCVLCLLLTFCLARVLKCPAQVESTLMLEVGVQNAGTALMIAYGLQQQAGIAGVALYYGILMNLPAAVVILWARKQRA